MSCKLALYLVHKAIKSVYTLLLVVLMVLWIVLCVEAVRQIGEISHRTKGRSEDYYRRMTPIQALASGSLSSTTAVVANRSAMSRLYSLTIFNIFLEEIIALFAILSIVLRVKKIFSLTLLLLIVIWYIEQYRISDFYHQIDYIEQQSSRLIIATHTIHFIIILIGIILSITDSVAMCRKDTIDSKKSTPTANTNATNASNTTNSNNTSVSTKSFEDIEKNVNQMTNNNNNEGQNSDNKERCAWMKKTFTKRSRDSASGTGNCIKSIATCGNNSRKSSRTGSIQTPVETMENDGQKLTMPN